eukprot:bmy_14377T0
MTEFCLHDGPPYANELGEKAQNLSSVKLESSFGKAANEKQKSAFSLWILASLIDSLSSVSFFSLNHTVLDFSSHNTCCFYFGNNIRSYFNIFKCNFEKSSPLLSSNYTTMTKQTGLVHTVPIHDKEDYSVDFQHNLLMNFSLDEDDIFTDVSEGTVVVINVLQAAKHLLKKDNLLSLRLEDSEASGYSCLQAVVKCECRGQNHGHTTILVYIKAKRLRCSNSYTPSPEQLLPKEVKSQIGGPDTLEYVPGQDILNIWFNRFSWLHVLPAESCVIIKVTVGSSVLNAARDVSKFRNTMCFFCGGGGGWFQYRTRFSSSKDMFVIDQYATLNCRILQTRLLSHINNMILEKFVIKVRLYCENENDLKSTQMKSNQINLSDCIN